MSHRAVANHTPLPLRSRENAVGHDQRYECCVPLALKNKVVFTLRVFFARGAVNIQPSSSRVVGQV